MRDFKFKGEINMTQILSFPNDEKETIARFDYIDQCWYVETNVPTHITKISKLTDVDVIGVSENGNPTLIEAKMEKSQISFRNKPREMTEEERLKRAEHMRNIRNPK